MSSQTIIERLQADLLAARKAHDRLKAEALQSTLSRIANAEAVPVNGTSHHPANGVGSTEVARRLLSEKDILHILQAEIDELQNAIADMRKYADNPYAMELRQKVQILQAYATPPKGLNA